MDKQTEEKFYKFLREGNKEAAYHLLVEERKKQVYPEGLFNPSQIYHFQDADKVRIAIVIKNENGENKYSFYTLEEKYKEVIEKGEKKQKRYYELELDKQGDSIFSENKERYINYDCNEINAWSRWYGNLDAEVLVIGQHFGDLDYFKEYQGKDRDDNPTCCNLIKLFESTNKEGSKSRTLDKPSKCYEKGNKSKKIFLTNAVLAIPETKDNVKKGIVQYDQQYLKRLIDILSHNGSLRIILPLGDVARKAVLNIKNNINKTIKIYEHLYLCSNNRNRSLKAQKKDWEEIKDYLDENKILV